MKRGRLSWLQWSRPAATVAEFGSLGYILRAMSKRGSDWYIPEDWLWHLSIYLSILCSAVLSSLLVPIVYRLKSVEVTTLYGVAVGTGVLGIVLLFIARLPLYRQRKFWTVGPRELDPKHRRLYWLAYAAVLLSLFLLLIVRFRTHES